MKSALESHLQTRHADRPTLTVDAIADLQTGDDCQLMIPNQIQPPNQFKNNQRLQQLHSTVTNSANASFSLGMSNVSEEYPTNADVVDFGSYRGSDEVYSIEDDDEYEKLSEDDENDEEDCFYNPDDEDDESVEYFITTTTRDDGTLAHFYNTHQQMASSHSNGTRTNGNNNNNNSVKINNNNGNRSEIAHNDIDQHPNAHQSQQQQKKRRHRTQMANQQVRILRLLFDDVKTPTMADCELVGRRIGLPKRVVQVCLGVH